MEIAVYCGSSDLAIGPYRAATERLAECLVEAGHDIVFGGGRIGLMGVLARSAHAAGGRVIGVIPESLRSVEGVSYDACDEVVVTTSMQERKRIIFTRADAFVVLPGGFGTLEEFAEVVTLNKLGYLEKPVALLNMDGFYDHLLGFLEHAREGGFTRVPRSRLFSECTHPDQVLPALFPSLANKATTES